MIGEDLTPFEHDATGENVYRRLNEDAMDEVEANQIDSDTITYMEPLAPDIEKIRPYG